jgi:hypothetical protein
MITSTANYRDGERRGLAVRRFHRKSLKPHATTTGDLAKEGFHV